MGATRSIFQGKTGDGYGRWDFQSSKSPRDFPSTGISSSRTTDVFAPALSKKKARQARSS
jgi:hypothetical protein